MNPHLSKKQVVNDACSNHYTTPLFSRGINGLKEISYGMISCSRKL